MMIDTFDTTTQEVLKELEKTQKQFWNISRLTAEFLYNLIVDSKAKSVVEVGTSNGYSGIWIGKALKKQVESLPLLSFMTKDLILQKKTSKNVELQTLLILERVMLQQFWNIYRKTLELILRLLMQIKPNTSNFST